MRGGSSQKRPSDASPEFSEIVANNKKIGEFAELGENDSVRRGGYETNDHPPILNRNDSKKEGLTQSAKTQRRSEGATDGTQMKRRLRQKLGFIDLIRV